MKKNYTATMWACYTGYITQAIVNNFIPLLFVTFCSTYGIPMEKITLLITLNFIIQLCIDAISTKLIDKIGYRTSAIIAHVCAGGGLILLSFLPELTPDPFVGILISVFVYALGGGLIEVLISPIVEACPTENKEKAMSLLHSFYCWGHVGVVLVSTAFFALFGIEKWRVLAILWAIIPVFNVFLFSVVPIYTLGGEDRKSTPLKKLFASGTFWLFMLMMVCAGAGEQAVSQWASAFAETGLNVSKTLGDLLGPMMFAFTMGLSRLIFGKFGEKMKLDVFMIISTCLCLCSYMLISLVNNAAVGLMGCALCGFSVGIMWPGTYSKAANEMPWGGTSMFALLALAGDVGCSAGPTLAGFVSGACGDDLKKGILSAIIFPVLMLVSLLIFTITGKKKKAEPYSGVNGNL